jgi:hypothetical protein
VAWCPGTAAGRAAPRRLRRETHKWPSKMS